MTPSPAPIGILGLGRSGCAAARFLSARGVPTLVWDARPDATLPLTDLPHTTLRSGHPLPADAFAACRAILLSPGVPRALPELAPLLAAGIPILNDVEWLHTHVRQECPQAHFVGITGSNGKSTVTTLIGEMLRHHGIATATGGNLGIPALELWDPAIRAYVLELSSFQLESIDAFHAEVAVHLNLTPDHLDRYPDLEGYRQAKRRLFANSRPGDRVILNADDPWLAADREELTQRQVTVIPFSTERTIPGGLYAHDGQLIDHRLSTPVPILPLDQIRIRGIHNQANAAAAAAAALEAGASRATVIAVLTSFPGLPHRMEPVRHLDGVDYFNDSKGTNVGATLMSLRSFAPAGKSGGGVVLIAGGRDKKGDFSALAPVAAQVVTDAILLGESAHDIAQALQHQGPRIHQVADLTQAVRLARTLATPGQSVLLSPACASFDMFKNFEERGDRFREAVHEL
ncbi:MAG: UDP-N-acetylmuramoyl-L-alanine--D-glutamate ligase [Magnetococcales bacterium]|nr:UDP-N-acetylmuramoyl-L-alanine--D-glutamate ligase [Magnetococcales bacterium]